MSAETSKSSHENVGEWLLSQNRFEKNKKTLPFQSAKRLKGTKSISLTSGKGGVGKTSVALKMAKMLADGGYRVLLLDCDFNLSNTSLKLGAPLNDSFEYYLKGEKKFEECLHCSGNFHLLSASNGNIELFEKQSDFSRDVIDLLVKHESFYDFVIMDSPAGLSRETLTLNAYCDYRFVVVTPDKSSITDSYSLMKILNTKYGINQNHLLLNKISSKRQYQRIVRSMSETVENFLNCRLQILGGLHYEELAVDEFDKFLMGEENSALHHSFFKVLGHFTEEIVESLAPGLSESFQGTTKANLGQDVQLSHA